MWRVMVPSWSCPNAACFSDLVSKRISPKTPSAPGTDERRNFCFVDFSTAEQAQAAVNALDGSEYKSGSIKVSIAVPRAERQPTQSYQS